MSEQINIKISKNDLKAIDEKAFRWGLTRSAYIKLASINANLDITLPGNFKKPKL